MVEGCAPGLGRLCFEKECIPNVIVPFRHFEVWTPGQGFPREVSRERTAIAWVCDFEPFDGCLEVRDVYFWFQEELDGLPSNKALGCECWN